MAWQVTIVSMLQNFVTILGIILAFNTVYIWSKILYQQRLISNFNFSHKSAACGIFFTSIKLNWEKAYRVFNLMIYFQITMNPFYNNFIWNYVNQSLQISDIFSQLDYKNRGPCNIMTKYIERKKVFLIHYYLHCLLIA